MKNNFFLALLLCTAATAGCSDKGSSAIDADAELVPAKPIALSAAQKQRAELDNRFALAMFRNVSAAVGSNTFFSPLSLNMALGMLYNGTSGDTRTELAQVMGFADFSEAEINEYYQLMSDALLSVDPLTELGIANSIWYRTGFDVKPPFVSINQQYFSAEVQSLDFASPDAASIINGWCADKTKDKIKEIIESPIPNDVVMYLINALYFKSKWQYTFDKSESREADFSKANGSAVSATFMHHTATLPYYADEHVQCVEMPYGNQAFSMVALLPPDGTSIEQLVEYLDSETWLGITQGLHEREVSVAFPRFKVECEIALNKPVQQAGILQIFNEGGLLNLSDNPYVVVSNIKQKTFVEVNEEGTEAAAVTAIGMEMTSAGPSSPTPFIANRPFLYLIREKSTGVILFVGRMDEPKES
ncbi:MAG: serpin family protein [Prevotellaceae bacterium]|jgi:serpin B|nr:serpin family protein [Prevotellaceae bacterium]